MIYNILYIRKEMSKSYFNGKEMQYIIGILIFLIILLFILHSLQVFRNTWHPFVADIKTLLLSRGFQGINVKSIIYYKTGHDTFTNFIKDINRAKCEVLISTYHVRNDIYKNILFDALINAKRRGCSVILCVGVHFTDNFFKKLVDNGVTVLQYNKLSFNNKYFSYKNHDKLVIIDDSILYFGSFVIGKTSLDKWIESGLKIVGDVKAFKNSVIDSLEKESFENDSASDSITDSSVCIPFWTSGKQFYGLYADVYYNMIMNAKKSIYLFNPYFVPPQQIIDALIQKSKDVDINLVVVSKGDHPIVSFSAWQIIKDMIKNAPNIKFYDYHLSHVHSKIMITDDENVVLGSGNLDYRSLFQMHETGVYVKSKDLYRAIKEHFDDIISKSKLVNSDDVGLIEKAYANNEILKALL